MVYPITQRHLRKADRPSAERFDQSELTAFLQDSGSCCSRPSHVPRRDTPNERAFFKRLKRMRLLKKMRHFSCPELEAAMVVE
jgi:hypothetical protein